MNSNEGVVKLLEQINERLGQLVALTAAARIANLSQKDSVETLGSAGLDARAISDITGYSLSSVAPVLSRSRGTNKKAQKA